VVVLTLYRILTCLLELYLWTRNYIQEFIWECLRKLLSANGYLKETGNTGLEQGCPSNPKNYTSCLQVFNCPCRNSSLGRWSLEGCRPNVCLCEYIYGCAFSPEFFKFQFQKSRADPHRHIQFCFQWAWEHCGVHRLPIHFRAFSLKMQQVFSILLVLSRRSRYPQHLVLKKFHNRTSVQACRLSIRCLSRPETLVSVCLCLLVRAVLQWALEAHVIDRKGTRVSPVSGTIFVFFW
jgi:hypothetical protein